MRTWLIVLATATACGNHASLLDSVMNDGATAKLWKLAPDGTEVGIVASPKAIALVLDGVAAVQKLATNPDFAPMKGTADAMIGALFGKPDGTPAEAGLSADKGFAMFITGDGVLGVMPIGDRDKFMATKHGTRGEVDSLNGNTCKPLHDYYICATNEKLFDRLGKGTLEGKAAELAGGHGDVEVYASQLPLFGGSAGDLGMTFEISRGQVTARGVWTGQPSGTLGMLAGGNAPKFTATNVSGFLALDVSKLLGALPPIPLAGGVLLDGFAKSLAGPLSAVIPAGSVDVQLTLPLTDAAPAKTAFEHCKELSTFLDLTEQQPANACRFRVQSALELEAWVDEAGKLLRTGAHRDAPSKAVTSALTPVGEELAHGDWTAVFWGRGTMLNVAGITLATADPPPAGSAALHALALVNELGLGIKVDAKGVRVRGVLRTAWANPPELVARLVGIPGADIITGRATKIAKPIVESAADAPFAADYEAGQGGLIVPAAVLSIAAAIILPAIDSLLGTGGSEEPPMPPLDDGSAG